MNLEILHEYHNDGLLYKQTHPSLPLTIWNYTEKVQYDGLWDEVTLQCRGLVTDDKGNIVARPFRKFFNIEEGKHTPTSEFDVFEKMDGSLGIFFYYKGEPVFASRGSFTSEQSIKGREILDKYNWQNGTYEGYTYLFEIIYPENRIVVDYVNMEELIVLGVIETETGIEVGYDDMVSEGFKIVRKYDFKDYNEIQKLNWGNHEGFVVQFSNFDRCKIKFEEYVRLHKIMTNLSTTNVWEVLSNGGSMDEVLKEVPDEFYDKIKEYEEELKFEFNSIVNDYNIIFRNTKDLMRIVDGDRKNFAYVAKKYKYPQILFALLDGKDISPIIWKIVKPEYEKL